MVLNIKSSIFWSTMLPVMLLLFLTVNFVWPDGSFRNKMVDGDGKGYYAYLPVMLLQHTVDFKQALNRERKNRPLEYSSHYFHRVGAVYVNKYSAGTALMILPFFLVAQVISPLVGLPADGYSVLYQYAVALAALWWLWVGLFFLRKLLKSYGVSERVTVWVVLLLLLGTNLFHYAFVEVAFSHVYSFAAITAFLWFLRLFFISKGKKYAFIAAFAFGMVVLIRPVNGMVVFAMPLLAENRQILKTRAVALLGSLKNVLLLSILFLLAISPQLIINYLQTGNLIVYGYRGEGFDFLHPRLGAFLFGFKKGWLIYTPVMLLLIPATIALWRRSKLFFYGFVFFLLMLIYIFSSWWNWFYGDGFGMRPMVDYYGLFALVIALWVDKLKPLVKGVLLLIVLLLSVLNIIQTYQYSKGIIHVDSMTREAYQYVFLRTSDKYRNVIGSADEYFYGKLSDQPLLSTTNTFEGHPTGWTESKHNDTLLFNSSKNSYCFDEEAPFSTSFNVVIDSVLHHRTYLIASLYFFEPVENAAQKALYVVDVRDSTDNQKFYKAFKIKRVPDKVVHVWRKSHIGIVLPRLEKGDKIKVYCWNKALSTFNIDDFSIRLFPVLVR